MHHGNALSSVQVVLCLLLLSATAIDGQSLRARGMAQPPVAAYVEPPSLGGFPSARMQSASAAPAAYENDMICWTTTGSVFYISDVFNAGQAPPGPRGRQGSQIAQSFLTFLQKKYGLTAQDHAVCGGPPAPTPEATQAYKQQQEDRAKQANKKIVETGWKKE
jgi:hypothetical protein